MLVFYSGKVLFIVILNFVIVGILFENYVYTQYIVK